jgi:hypothetical protein
VTGSRPPDLLGAGRRTPERPGTGSAQAHCTAPDREARFLILGCGQAQHMPAQQLAVSRAWSGAPGNFNVPPAGRRWNTRRLAGRRHA